MQTQSKIPAVRVTSARSASRPERTRHFGLLALLALVGLLAIGWAHETKRASDLKIRTQQTGGPVRDVAAEATASSPSAPPSLSRQEQYRRFYDDQVAPLLHKNRGQNDSAAEQCLGNIAACFAAYQTGIRPFADDLTSVGSRLHVLIQMPTNMWYQDSRLEKFIQRKFSVHMVSDEQLKRDLAAALNNFLSAVAANRNQLLGEVRLAVQQSDFSGTDQPNVEWSDTVYRQWLETIVLKDIAEDLEDRAIQDIQGRIEWMLASKVLRQATVAVGRQAASQAIATGGATAAGAAVGVGGGSTAGPIGSVVGLGVGITIGILCDWWSTAQFRLQLIEELSQHLEQLHETIVDGTDGNYGLRQILNQIVESNDQQNKLVMNRVYSECFQ